MCDGDQLTWTRLPVGCASLAALPSGFITARTVPSGARNCQRLLVNAGCAEAAALGRRFKAFSYGLAPDADAVLEVRSLGPDRAQGILRLASGELHLDVPQPGRHNLENAAAAAVVGIELGLDPHAIASILARFPGVARRFEVVGTTPSGIRVVDDYAHNAEKLRAALTTAQGPGRVVAVFQPHGFGPARFLRPELKTMLPAVLRPEDRFCYAEIFYAGGTVARDFSSQRLVEDLPAAMRCGFAAGHEAARLWVQAVARPAPGEDLYFVAVGDGSGRHLFARSLAEHEANVQRYLQRYRRARSAERAGADAAPMQERQ